MAVTALAAPADPGEVAVRFLEKARAGTAKLGPGEDTALSPATSAEKRAQIARRLEHLARDFGNAALEAGPVKVDDELAAVLVRNTGGFDPGRMQVHPVALVRRGRDWLPAPVPASFENSGIGYDPAIRRRTRALEEWMLRQRAIDLETLRAQAAGRMRQSISQSLSRETLEKLDSRQTAERFLHACGQHNLPEVLGLLGGLADSLPDDWPLRLRAAEAALAAPAKARHPWHLLLAPEVLRLIVDHDENQIDGPVMISIACLDPAGHPPYRGTQEIELIHLELAKTRDGLWRIDPPEAMLRQAPAAEVDEAPDALDAGLLANFRRALVAKYPAIPSPTPAAARAALLAALRDGRSFAWLSHIELARDPRGACTRAARLWWELGRPQSPRHAIPLALREAGNAAAVSCLIFDTRHTERFDVRFLFFSKTPAGWLWQPDPGSTVRSEFGEWTSGQAAHWKDAWRDTLLADSIVIAPPLAQETPPEPRIRSLMEAWFRAVRSGSLAEALRLTARLNLPDSMEIHLRNLGYEINGAEPGAGPPAITAIQSGDGLAMAAVKTDARGKSRLAVFPVVQTPAGPRILLETDLAVSGGRTREFLNRISLERIGKFDPAAAANFKKHFEAVLPAIKAPPQQ